MPLKPLACRRAGAGRRASEAAVGRRQGAAWARGGAQARGERGRKACRGAHLDIAFREVQQVWQVGDQDGLGAKGSDYQSYCTSTTANLEHAFATHEVP